MNFIEVMQAIPHRMTQGTVEDTFNKYYDGTTSKVKYREDILVKLKVSLI